MRCAACDEGGLDTGTTLNRLSLGVLLMMRGGLDTGTTLNRSSLGVLFVMREDLDRVEALHRTDQAYMCCL